MFVEEASATEGTDATIDFEVTLSKPHPSRSVWVAWDYHTWKRHTRPGLHDARGVLVFAVGETSKTISIALLDDAISEGVETLNLHLGPAVGATLFPPDLAPGKRAGSHRLIPLSQERFCLMKTGRTGGTQCVARISRAGNIRALLRSGRRRCACREDKRHGGNGRDDRLRGYSQQAAPESKRKYGLVHQTFDRHSRRGLYGCKGDAHLCCRGDLQDHQYRAAR